MSYPLYNKELREHLAAQFVIGEAGVVAVWQSTFFGVPIPDDLCGKTPHAGDRFVLVTESRTGFDDSSDQDDSRHTVILSAAIFQSVDSDNPLDLADTGDALREFLNDKCITFMTEFYNDPDHIDGAHVAHVRRQELLVREAQNFSQTESKQLLLLPATLTLEVKLTTTKGVTTNA